MGLYGQRLPAVESDKVIDTAMTLKERLMIMKISTFLLAAMLSFEASAQAPKLPETQAPAAEVPVSKGAPKEVDQRNPDGAGVVRKMKHPTYEEVMKKKEPASFDWAKLKLKDENGKTFSMDKFRGKLLLVNFFFTHCPDVCPPQTAALNAVMTKLGKFEQDSIHFVSITIDPDNDTQAELQKYKKQFAIKGNNWSFARTDKDTLSKLGTHFGALSGDPKKPLDHRARLFLIKDDGTYLLSYEAAPVDIERMNRDLTGAVRNFIKPKK